MPYGIVRRARNQVSRLSPTQVANYAMAGYAGSRAVRYATNTALRAAPGVIRKVYVAAKKRIYSPPTFSTIQPGRVRQLGGGKARFQRGKKLKVFNPAPKGRAKKFVKKVMKAINSTGSYGEYRYIGAGQLRQGAVNEYGQTATDVNVQPFCMNMKTSWDANSVLWGSKVATYQTQTVTGNIDQGTPFNVLRNDISFFFKSTSGHVVNIEAYECTYKKPTEDDPFGLALVSTDDIDLLYKIGLGGTGVAPAVASTYQYGTQISMYATLMNFCSVKKHLIKLKPGDHASLFIKGSKGIVDPSKNESPSTNDVNSYVKGSKCMYFRIINDPTISATSAEVNHWPSNSIGGVAMEYTRVIRVQAPVVGASAVTKNKILILRTSETGSGGDQQVTVALQSTALPQ